MTDQNLTSLRLKVNAEIGFELYTGCQLLARYNAATDHLSRQESPKPCFHPIYTHSDNLITEYRPHDHTWHTGLFFGWVHVNETNFWGGSWYLPEEKKYVAVPNSHGIQRHDEFTPVLNLDNSVTIGEKLTWLDRYDQPVIKESRKYSFQETATRRGCLWLIDTEIVPIVGDVTLGASRAARYSGLVLRMGPPFADAFHTSDTGRSGHESIMQSRGRWVSAAGASGGMVVMMDHTRNIRHPVHWFTRKNLLGSGLLMNDDLNLCQSEALNLSYGFLVLEDVVDRQEIECYYQAYLKESDNHFAQVPL